MKLLNQEEAYKALQLEAEFYQQNNLDRIRQLQYESQLKSLDIEQQNYRLLLTTFSLMVMFVLAVLIFFYWLQRKRMIQTLQEANDTNQRIISMISHDFRGPLNNVKLTLELLQSEDIEIGEFNVLTKDLYRQSADLALMFDSFVGWAISQRDGYNPINTQFQWRTVIEEVINISIPLAALKQIKLKWHGPQHLEVETDRMAVMLILRNLVSNAIKYSHHNSSIEIEYVLSEDHAVTFIRDRGIGMSQERLEKILTTGDGSTQGTNNEYGSGLGLRMVIKYVRSIGGTITAQSQEGKGTTFEVGIPVNLERADQSKIIS